MSVLTLLVVVLLVILILGAYPHGPWYGTGGATWGYGPMGGLGLILIIILVLLLLGYPARWSP